MGNLGTGGFDATLLLAGLAFPGGGASVVKSIVNGAGALDFAFSTATDKGPNS